MPLNAGDSVRNRGGESNGPEGAAANTRAHTFEIYLRVDCPAPAPWVMLTMIRCPCQTRTQLLNASNARSAPAGASGRWRRKLTR